MRSEFSRKQCTVSSPVNVVPAKLPSDRTLVDRRHDFSVRSSLVSSSDNSHTVRASPEMTSAIRRQQGTTGVDYWQTANPTVSKQSRKASFQNLFFPNVDVNGYSGTGSSSKSMKMNSNGTDIKSSGTSFTRPLTSMSLPGVGTRPKEQQCTEPKKAVVLDLTSLHVRDSLLPSKSSQLSYFYQLCRAKVRYMDYLDDTIGYCKTDSDEQRGQPVRVGYEMERMHSFTAPVRRPADKLRQHVRTMSLPLVPSQKRIAFDNGHFPAQRSSVVRTSSSRRPENPSYSEDSVSKRPILKQTYNQFGKQHRSDVGDLAVRGTVFTVSQNGRHKGPLIHGDPRRNTRSSSVPAIATANLHSGDRSKKRAVHFSVSNEVFEYAPTDPIRY